MKLPDAFEGGIDPDRPLVHTHVLSLATETENARGQGQKPASFEALATRSMATAYIAVRSVGASVAS